MDGSFSTIIEVKTILPFFYVLIESLQKKGLVRTNVNKTFTRTGLEQQKVLRTFDIKTWK